MSFSQTERAELCQLLDEVGPQAPTLCAGWTTHDLASHLWIRECDPLGAPGIVAKPLAGVTQRRMAATKRRWPYLELVDRIRRGPAPPSIFAIRGFDEAANTVEFFIHHEDVRRAGATAPPRKLPTDIEDKIWRRLHVLGPVLYRHAEVGVVLECNGAAHEPKTIRVHAGSQTVTLIGQPSELLLYAYGRRAVSQIRQIGEPEALIKLAESGLAN